MTIRQSSRQDSPADVDIRRERPSENRPKWAGTRAWGRFRWSRYDAMVAPYLFVSPFFVLFGAVGLFPLLYTAWVALHDWNLIAGQGEFVGLDNFAAVLEQRQFWLALRNTLSMFVLHVVPLLVFGILIAAALDRNLRAGGFWRLLVLLPFVVMPVAVTLIFGSLYAERYGLINNVLTSIGLSPVGWYSDALASHFAISTMVDYRWTGYVALIFLAGMQAIPRDYYEAATIDGAGVIRQFFSITIPQLRGTIIFVVITATIGGLQIFDEPRLYDTPGQGGPDGQWLSLALYLYNVGWKNLNFGQAAAIAWLLFLLIVIIALINFVISSRIARNEEVGR